MLVTMTDKELYRLGIIQRVFDRALLQRDAADWICPYISRHLLSLNPLLARCRRYSRGER